MTSNHRIRRARQSPRTIPAGAMRYVRGARIRPGRVVIGPHSQVSGDGRWDIAGKLTIGVIGMAFSAAVDTTVVRNDGELHTSGHVLINRGARVVVAESASLRIGDGMFINCFTIVHATSAITIGAGSRILDGSVIGDGCVVAAGSVVSGAFAARTLFGGSPARVIRSDVDWAM